jgi:hypothetical protein
MRAARTVNGNEPSVVGVPESTPSVAPRVSPGGSWPLVTVHASGLDGGDVVVGLDFMTALRASE